MTFSRDEAAISKATVTPAAGGTVSAKGSDGSSYTLTVPAHAVVASVDVSLVPLLHVQGIPSDKPLAAVMMEPAGLTFAQPATLEIDPATPYPTKTQAMFLADDAGRPLQLALVDVKSTAMRMEVPHFTIAAAGSLNSGVYGSFANEAVANSLGWAQAEAASILGAARQAALLGVETNTPIPSTVTDSMARLEGEIQAAFMANSGDCTAAQQLIVLLLGIERQSQLLGAQPSSSLTSFTNMIEEAYPACEQQKIKACKDARDPGILLGFWYGFLRQQVLLGVEPATLPGGEDPSPEHAQKVCAPAYVVSGGSGAVTFSGVAKDLKNPFTVTVTSPGASGDATLYPSSETAGTIKGQSTVAGGTEVTTGDYHLTKTSDGYVGTGTVTTCLTIQGHTTCSPAGVFQVTLTPQQ